MKTRVDYNDLILAFEWISSSDCGGFENNAYVSKETGAVHWASEDLDEELPEDIEDETKYAAVPTKSDLDMGRRLVLRFAQDHLPESYDLVESYFRKRGAYSRFKDLIQSRGKLETWYQYEQQAIDEELRLWCEANDLELYRTANPDAA